MQIQIIRIKITVHVATGYDRRQTCFFPVTGSKYEACELAVSVTTLLQLYIVRSVE